VLIDDTGTKGGGITTVGTRLKIRIVRVRRKFAIAEKSQAEEK